MNSTMVTTSPRERELRGHGNERLELPMQSDSSPKLCECGCGQPAPIATKTYAKWGHVPGMPMRFVRGHNNRGVKMPSAGRARLSAAWKGASNPRWAGGIHGDARGYTLLILDEEDQFASMRDSRGRVYRHRIIMAAMLGRPLTADEEVHHVDLDQTNDAPANLILVSGPEHSRIHGLIRHGADPVEATQRVIAERHA